MALTIVGGSNYLGRFLIRNMHKEYSEIRLADMYPFRDAVYALQHELDLPLVKQPLAEPTNLKYALEGAKTVFIVTHDYFKLAHSKNFYLKRTAQFAKAAGVERLICLAPLEFDQLNKLDGDPATLISEAEETARSYFPELSILKTNLVFGPSATSLVLCHAIEAMKNGKQPLTANQGHTKFQPVHHDEVLTALKALKKGETQTISGPEVLNWVDITELLAKHVGVSPPKHDGTFDSLRAMVATCEYTGDIVYPSHLQQFYRLLSRDRVPTPTITGTKSMREHFVPEDAEHRGHFHWHRVIID